MTLLESLIVIMVLAFIIPFVVYDGERDVAFENAEGANITKTMDCKGFQQDHLRNFVDTQGVRWSMDCGPDGLCANDDAYPGPDVGEVRWEWATGQTALAALFALSGGGIPIGAIIILTDVVCPVPFEGEL